MMTTTREWTGECYDKESGECHRFLLRHHGGIGLSGWDLYLDGADESESDSLETLRSYDPVTPDSGVELPDELCPYPMGW